MTTLELPLHTAVKSGNIDEVSSAISLGAEINKLDRRQQTPLLVASYLGYADICELLLTCGADLTIVNEDGFSPLHTAIIGGQYDVLERLLLNPSAPDVIKLGDCDGDTPLHMAAIAPDNRFIRALLAAGAPLWRCNSSGKKAWDLAFDADLRSNYSLLNRAKSQKRLRIVNK